MTDLDLDGLALFPAPPLLLLVVGFAVAAGAFGVQPGLEEGGRVEVGLDVADDLGGGYAGGFIDGWRGGRDRGSAGLVSGDMGGIGTLLYRRRPRGLVQMRMP